jgi:hypothetical protein
VDHANIGELRLNQWEATYINQIPRGTVWQRPDDWTFFSPLRCVPTIDGIVEGEEFTGEWHFVIPDKRGRLHIQWQHALSAMPDEPEREIIQLTLTARGPLEPRANDTQPVLNGLDLGRETIVRAFAHLMSNEANKHWGLINAAH